MLEGISTGQTAWWTWTAPSNGIVTLNVSASSFYPLLTVYTGTSLETLSLIASNNYLACYEHGCGCNWRVRNYATFHVARGRTYQVALDSELFTDSHYVFPLISQIGSTNIVVPDSGQTTNVLAGSDFNLQFHFTPAPKNDDFADRTKLRGSRPHINTSNAGATGELGEPHHLGNSGGSSVWYSWTAPASGRVTFSINNIPPYQPPSWHNTYGFYASMLSFAGIWNCGSEIDQNPPPQFFPVFAAYTGSSIESLISANPLPLALSAFPYAVTFDAAKGQAYQIAFDGNMGTTGETPLYLALTKPAANNNFKNRIQLHGINLVATSYNAGATHQPGEPAPPEGSTGKTVWWSWRAPVSGSVSVDVSQSEYQFPVSIFAGSTLSELRLITSSDSPVSFEATAGEIYQIAVSDSSGLTGAINLSLQAPVIELPLIQDRTLFARRSLLRYAASQRQIILLQRSKNDGNWENVRLVLARRNSVEFLVSPVPVSGSIVYRAIIVDWPFR